MGWAPSSKAAALKISLWPRHNAAGTNPAHHDRTDQNRDLRAAVLLPADLPLPRGQPLSFRGRLDRSAPTQVGGQLWPELRENGAATYTYPRDFHRHHGIEDRARWCDAVP